MVDVDETPELDEVDCASIELVDVSEELAVATVRLLLTCCGLTVMRNARSHWVCYCC